MRRSRFLMIAFAMAFLCVGAFVFAKGEKALPGPADDVAPDLGGDYTPVVPPSQVLAFGDELGVFNAQSQTGDNQCVGVGWDGTYIWVTGAGYYLGGVNYMYRFGLDGIFQVMFPQLTTAYWGWRDLAFEENASNPGTIKGYLWGSEEGGIIEEFDPNTGVKTGNSLPSPLSPARALGWEPPDASGARGYLWTCNYSSSIYRVNIATGTSEGPFSNTMGSVYGCAWDDCIGSPPRLYWSTQSSPDRMIQWDPITKAQTGVTILPSYASGIAGGLSWAKDCTFFGDPTLAVLLSLWQNWTGAQDQVVAYELCIAQVPNDMTVTSIDEPGVTVMGDFTPVITVRNIGMNDQTDCPVRVTIANKASVEVYNEVMYTGPMVSMDELTLNFPLMTIDAGELYYIEACTELSNDDNPANDCKDLETVVLDGVLGFEDAGCFAPAGSWEWGAPSSAIYGPPSAHSGLNLWGTVLAGPYSANACDELVGSFMALDADPILMYYHWYDIETTYDGYNLKMSLNGGAYSDVAPVGGYPGTSPYAGCIAGQETYAGTSDWAMVRFDLPGVAAGDMVDLKWTFGSDASVQYSGIYIDDMGLNRLDVVPPETDLDIDDAYGNLVGNTMLLYGPRTKGSTPSMCFGSFVVVNPDETNNVDYWDGPASTAFTTLSYAATDLATFHKPDDPIPAANISVTLPAGLATGEAYLAVVGVEMPSKIEYGENDHESKVYRGTVTVTGESDTECGYSSSSDAFTLKVKGVHSTGGGGLPTNAFISEWGENGLAFSWGEFDFANSFNLYREDDKGDFVRLNSTPLPQSTTYIDENMVEGLEYCYKFGIVLPNGEELVFGPMTAKRTRIPSRMSLMPSSPNPMSTETSIRYSLAADADVSLAVYNASGAVVKTLVNEHVTAGYHTVNWNGTNEAGDRVANGVYFYRLASGDFSQSRKVVVLK